MAQLDDDFVTVIDCGEEITFSNVHRLRATVGDNKQLVDAAFNLLAEKPKWVFKDAEIAFLMPDHCYVLHSGARTNQFVILIGELGQAEVKLIESGWKLFIRDQTLAIWNWVKDNRQNIIDLVQFLYVLYRQREAIEGRAEDN